MSYKINVELAELRESNGYTQKYVSDSINVSKQTYSNWERGVRQVDLNSLITLANFYEVSVDYILRNHLNSTLDLETEEIFEGVTVRQYIDNIRKLPKEHKETVNGFYKFIVTLIREKQK